MSASDAIDEESSRTATQGQGNGISADVSQLQGSGHKWTRSRMPWFSVSFILIVVLIALAGSQYILYEATLVAIYGLVAVSQDWLFGRAGQISLGAAALMTVGAFTTARMSSEAWGQFPAPIVVSFIFGGLVGLVVGVPGLRFKGIYLMLTTLALQVIVSFAAQEYQGADNDAGFAVVAPHWGSLQLGGGRSLFIISSLILAAALVALDGMLRSAPGRAWSAIRQHSAAAATLGINPTRWKLLAFVGSSSLASVAGSLYAYQIGQVSYSYFTLDLSIALLIMVFIGGIGSTVGPLIGAAIVVLLPSELQELSSSSLLQNLPGISMWLDNHEAVLSSGVFGALLLVVLLFERGGIYVMVQRLAIAIGRTVLHRWGAVRGAR
jgi:branched-chain amino acid transport system permease protein